MRKDTLLQIANDKLIHAFKANDEVVLKTIYQDNYSKVRLYVLQNNGSEQQAKDIYQEAFLALWKNVKNQQFIPKNKTSLYGYLYTIAKNKWIDYLRSSDYKKIIASPKLNGLDMSKVESEVIDETIENNDKINKAMLAFDSLGDACKILLTKVYFEKKSMKEIAIELKLDAASTRNKKYRCMQKLRELALKK